MEVLKTTHAIYGEVGHLTTVGMKHMIQRVELAAICCSVEGSLLERAPQSWGYKKSQL